MSQLTRLLSCAIAVAFMAYACASNEKDQAQQTIQKIEDKTKEVAGDVADKSKEVVSATGEAITDGWITAKLKAKFSDEKLLKDSKIDVDAKDRVITLKGTVASAEAKKRAVSVASGTEGVLSVVDQLEIRKK